MKVLMIINSLMSGGAEKLVRDMAIALCKDVNTISLLLLGEEKSNLAVDLSNNHPQIKLIRLGKNNNIYNPLNIFKIWRIIKNFDVVHVHLFPAFYWSGIASLLTFKEVSLIYTEHNITNRRRVHFLLKRVDPFIYSLYDRIITISKPVDQALKKAFPKIPESKIKLIHNGIDLSEIKKAKAYHKSELGLKDEDIVLMQVSSFTVQKDQKTLLETLRELPEQFKLLMVGNGPLLDEIVNYSNSLDLKDRVFFLGIRSDVPRLLKTVDINIHSTKYEGLSLSCLEAMATEKPFLASRAPGVIELIEKDDFMFEIGNSAELQTLIIKIKKDPHYRDLNISFFKQRVLQYQLHKMINAYLLEYKTLKSE